MPIQFDGPTTVLDSLNLDDLKAYLYEIRAIGSLLQEARSRPIADVTIAAQGDALKQEVRNLSCVLGIEL